MARVFVSHSGADVGFAAEVHGWLTADGHEVFLDRDSRDGIVLGEEWQRRLHERLRWADAVVCVVTSSYASSLWCAAEVAVAQSRGSRLLPLRAEANAEHPYLRSVQHVNVVTDAEAARIQLREALRQVDATGGSGWPDDRSPFPGLRAFEADRHQVFCGRDGDATALVDLLRSPAERANAALLLVVGPSGCGKSSLVRAGVLPTMAAEPGWWALAPMLPGRDPVGVLARELAAGAQGLGLGWSVAGVRRRLDIDGLCGVTEELLLAASSEGSRRLTVLLVVDQFEELLTQTPAADQARFAQLLSPALGDTVQVVATLRPEFLEAMLVSPTLAGLATRTFTLRPLTREALSIVIEEPARKAGIEVEQELVAKLVADTESGAALPLLAYTLARLADGVARGDRLLASRYEQLGGVRGTLTRQADLALTEATQIRGRAREVVIQALLSLVTVDEAGRPTRWRVRLTDLDAAAAELTPFVNRRLLITDAEPGPDTADHPAVVEVAHEAFLSAWAPLAQAIADNAAALRARRSIEQAAEGWSSHGRAPTRLWERGQLTSALNDTGAQLRRTGPMTVEGAEPAAPQPTGTRWWPLRERTLVGGYVELSPLAREFLQLSIRRDRRRRGRSTTFLAVLLVLALVGAGVALVQQQSAQDRQRLATAQLLVTRAEQARASDPRAALLLGEAAQHIYPDADTRSSLVQTLLGTRYSGILTGHTGPVRSVAFSPDGNILASGSADNTVRLWDFRNPTRPHPLGAPLTGHTDRVNLVAFSPNGRVLASASRDSTIRLWDLSDPAHPHPLGPPLIGHTKGVGSVAFSPDGHTLASGSADDTVRLWDVTDPARPRPLGPPLIGHTQEVESVAFSPDGRTLASGSDDFTVGLWDVSDPTRPHLLGAPLNSGSNVLAVAFSPDGRTLASAEGDNAVGLWDLSDPFRPHSRGSPLTGYTNEVFAVSFSPSGRVLATGSADHTVRLWDVTDPTQPRPLGSPLTGHNNGVETVAFSPDHRTLVSGSDDNTIIMWDLTGHDPVPLGPPLTGPSNQVESVAFSPDGHTLATGSYDNTVRLWDLTDPTRPRPLGAPLTGHTKQVETVAFSPDGHTLASGSDDGTVRLWDLSDPTQPRPLPPLTGQGDVFGVTFSPHGHTLAVVGARDAVSLWDTTDTDRPRSLGAPLTTNNLGLYKVVFSPDGRTLAGADSDGTVRLWDVTDPAHPRSLGPPLTGHTNQVRAVAFSPDGHTLASAGDDKTVILWDVTNPTRPRALGPPLAGHTNVVNAVAFSPDGHTVASSGQDQTVILWDVTDSTRPQELAHLTNPGYIWSVAFSPNGHTLAAGSSDGTVPLWDLTSLNALRDHAIERACAITSGGMSPPAWAAAVPGLDYENACDFAETS